MQKIVSKGVFSLYLTKGVFSPTAREILQNKGVFPYCRAVNIQKIMSKGVFPLYFIHLNLGRVGFKRQRAFSLTCTRIKLWCHVPTLMLWVALFITHQFWVVSESQFKHTNFGSCRILNLNTPKFGPCQMLNIVNTPILGRVRFSF